jgi:outer membrane protein assembly factor BamB
VWTVFGNRGVVCRDLDGNLVWSDVLPDNPQAMWGHSSSPVLAGDKLIVNIDQIVAFDAATGRQIWRTKYGQSWGSPVQVKLGDEFLVLMANGRMVRASDGKVVKRVAGLADTSPIVLEGVAYYIDIRSEAHQLPSVLSPGVESIDVNTLWTAALKGGDFFGSAIVHDGLIYAVSTRQVLNVIDAKTGQSVYVKRLSLGAEPVWPSLCLAGKYLYASGRDGSTLVFKPGREYQEVAKNQLENFISTPMFDGDRMFVRTKKRLYCIAEQP